MTPRRLFLLGITFLTAWSVASPAGAIPNTCPTNGPDAGTVNITEPPPGANFAGQVTVRGRASASAGLTRVELFVGEALKDYQSFDPGRADVEFLLRFDVASVQSNSATLTVVACGGSPGSAVRGIASIDVKVDRAAVVTAPPIAFTPVERGDDRPGADSRTGPAWVGAAFGLAGLAGLVAATRFRGAPVASGPSPEGASGAQDPGRPSPVRGRVAAENGSPPPRPSPVRRGAEARAGAGPGPAAEEAGTREGATAPAVPPDGQHGRDGQDGQDGEDVLRRPAPGPVWPEPRRPRVPAPGPSAGDGSPDRQG